MCKKQTHQKLKIIVRDLSPKFLAFYKEAVSLKLNEKQRWLLWKKMYDFAAVPPTSQDTIARKLLNSAWSRYPEVIRALQSGDLIGEPKPEKILQSITKILKPENFVTITYLSYIGGFEDNAFKPCCFSRKRLHDNPTPSK